jgi:hypothetical protein
MKNEKVILVDAYNCLFDENGINKELFDILESFPNKKIVLTNADDEQMVKFGIDKSPYEVFTLRHNPNKTDDGYYEKMLNHLNLKAKNCIYIEHDPRARIKALENGIYTLIGNSVFHDALKEFILDGWHLNYFNHVRSEYLMLRMGLFYEDEDYVSYFLYVAFMLEFLFIKNKELIGIDYENKRPTLMDKYNYFIEKNKLKNENDPVVTGVTKKLKEYILFRNDLIHLHGKNDNIKGLKKDIKENYSWYNFKGIIMNYFFTIDNQLITKIKKYEKNTD